MLDLRTVENPQLRPLGRKGDVGSGRQGPCVSTLAFFWEMPWLCVKAEWTSAFKGFDVFLMQVHRSLKLLEIQMGT